MVDRTIGYTNHVTCMQKRTVSFIGLGGQSSGSGFLYTYLQAHPATCIPNTPTRFFSDPHRYAQGIVWYESRFNACRPKYIRGECTTEYLDTPAAVERIAHSYPQAKLLAVVCNPVERLYREYQRAIKGGSITEQVSLARYIELNPESLTRGLFGEHLDAYFARYSPLQLCVAVHEDRYEDPVGYVQDVYRFLEIDDTFVPRPLRRFIQVDPDEKPSRPWWLRLLSAPLAPLRWLRLDRAARWLWRTVWPPVCRFLVQRNILPAQNTNTIRAPKAAPIDPELRSLLHEYYAADVYKLSQLLERNLVAEWGIERPEK